MEEMIFKYVSDKLPLIGVLFLMVYWFIKWQLADLREEIEDLESERKDCENRCKVQMNSYLLDIKHLENSVNKGFEEIKIAIAEIRTELNLMNKGN